MNNQSTGSLSAFVTANPTFADLEEVDDFLAHRDPTRSARADHAAANLRWNDDSRLSFKYDTGQFGHIKLALGDELRDLATHITCPTTVLRGQRSTVISTAAAAELAELIPGAAWAQVPTAGHTLQSSNPVGVATEIIALIDALCREGPPGTGGIDTHP